jgi:hypothetical protein
MTLPLPSEELEQATFVQWLELKGIPFSAIPNSTYTTSWKQKAKNTRTGLRPGLPDLLLVLPYSCLVFIEMKKQKRGVVSVAQKQWIETLNTVPNVQAYVCKGADEAIEVVERLLSNGQNFTGTTTVSRSDNSPIF